MTRILNKLASSHKNHKKAYQIVFIALDVIVAVYYSYVPVLMLLSLSFQHRIATITKRCLYQVSPVKEAKCVKPAYHVLIAESCSAVDTMMFIKNISILTYVYSVTYQNFRFIKRQIVKENRAHSK